MTDDTMAFFNLDRERGEEGLLKELAETVLQKLMDYDENLVGTACTRQRNGQARGMPGISKSHRRPAHPHRALGQRTGRTLPCA